MELNIYFLGEFFRSLWKQIEWRLKIYIRIYLSKNYTIKSDISMGEQI